MMQIQYSRIRVKDFSDAPRIYSLVIDYIENPAHAETVTEFVFLGPPNEPIYQFKHDDRLPEFQAAEKARNVSGEKALSDVVERFGLGQSRAENSITTEDWVKALTWMKRDLVAERAREPVLSRLGLSASFAKEGTRNVIYHATILLLMLCSNIERLVFAEESYLLQHILRLNNYGLLPEKALQKLKHVELVPTNDLILGDERFYTHMDLMRMVQCFHQLPSLESISVTTSEINPGSGSTVNFLYPHTSNLKKLNIEHAMFNDNAVTWLIRMAKALEDFTWSCGGRASNDGTGESFHGEKVGKALLCQRETLRHLDLDIDDALGPPYEGREEDLEAYAAYEGEEYEEDEQLRKEKDDAFRPFRPDCYITPGNECYAAEKALDTGLPIFTWQLPTTRAYEGTIGSMHDFNALKHLSIGIKLLLGQSPHAHPEYNGGNPNGPHRLVDALPPNLEYLLIRGYKKGEFEFWDSQVEEFQAKRAEKFPALREVHGLDAYIPSAEEFVEDPDDNHHLLWERPGQDEDWKEVE
jgi:hypothetical protein